MPKQEAQPLVVVLLLILEFLYQQLVEQHQHQEMDTNIIFLQHQDHLL
jgi:hypothetical protein